MDAVSYLECIIIEARTALDSAMAGGKRQSAFESMISIDLLHRAFTGLFDLNSGIDEEIEE